MFGGNTVVNMGRGVGGRDGIAKRINLLSSLRKYYVIKVQFYPEFQELSPPTLQYISKRAAYKAHDGNDFIQRQLDESNIVSPRQKSVIG